MFLSCFSISWIQTFCCAETEFENFPFDIKYKYLTFIDRENYDSQFCEVNDAGEQDAELHRLEERF